MSPTPPQEQPTAPTLQIPRALATILADVRLLMVAVVGLFGSGFYAYAQVREVAQSTATQTTAGLDASVGVLTTRLAAHEAASLYTHDEIREELKDLRADTRATRAEVEGLRADLRRLFPALPSVDAGSRDGGVQ